MMSVSRLICGHTKVRTPKATAAIPRNSSSHHDRCRADLTKPSSEGAALDEVMSSAPSPWPSNCHAGATLGRGEGSATLAGSGRRAPVRAGVERRGVELVPQGVLVGVAAGRGADDVYDLFFLTVPDDGQIALGFARHDHVAVGEGLAGGLLDGGGADEGHVKTPDAKGVASC